MQLECFELPTLSFCLVDYRQVLINCETSIIDDLYQFDLLNKLNMRNNDTKKIMYHHVIHEICESVLNVKTTNKVILYNNLSNIQLELFKHSTRTQVINFLNTLTRQVKQLLPVKIYDHEDDFDIFTDRCKESRGELRARAAVISEFLRKQQNKRFDFEKAKKFAEKYELTYLSQQYFNNIKIKNLVFI